MTNNVFLKAIYVYDLSRIIQDLSLKAGGGSGQKIKTVGFGDSLQTGARYNFNESSIYGLFRQGSLAAFFLSIFILNLNSNKLLAAGDTPQDLHALGQFFNSQGIHSGPRPKPSRIWP